MTSDYHPTRLGMSHAFIYNAFLINLKPATLVSHSYFTDKESSTKRLRLPQVIHLGWDPPLSSSIQSSPLTQIVSDTRSPSSQLWLDWNLDQDSFLWFKNKEAAGHSEKGNLLPVSAMGSAHPLWFAMNNEASCSQVQCKRSSWDKYFFISCRPAASSPSWADSKHTLAKEPIHN